jgi:hypothetical protein
MEIIANLWWVWMIGAVVTLLYGGYNQVSRIRRMMSSPEKGFFQGIYTLFIAAVIHLAFVVMLVTSIVINIIAYAKQ